VPLPISSHTAPQPLIHLTTSTPELRSQKHDDSVPPSGFLRIFGKWKKSIRKPAVPEPCSLADIQSMSTENLANASNKIFSTMAEGRRRSRTVRKVADQKKKKKARPSADGDRNPGTNTGGRPMDPGPLSKVPLPLDVHGDHECGTSTGRPLDPKASSGEVQQAKYSTRPSTWNVRLNQESGVATLSFRFPAWLCCCSSETKEG